MLAPRDLAGLKRGDHMSTAHDFPLSPRVQEGLRLVQAGRFSKKEKWGEDLSVLDGSSANLPLVKRKALAIEKVLSEMPVSIRRHELLVGSAVQTLLLSMAVLPEYATQEEVETAAERLTSPLSVWGHATPSYPRLLQLGFNGLLDLAKGKLEEIRVSDAKQEEEAWYESVVISLQALRTLVQRYRELALKLAAQEEGEKRKRELHEIAGVLRHLLEGPPATFHQALQAVWISHIAFLSTQNFLPFGRFDQYLWPFLKRDLENRALTLAAAQELVDLFWLKCNDLLQAFQIQEPPGSPDDPVPAFAIPIVAGFLSVFLGGKTTADRVSVYGGTSQQFLQTLTLGGLTPEGEDGTNPLTFLCLNATLRLGLPQPCTYVRFHKGSPAELYQRVADSIRAGRVGPTIYNDEVLVSAYVQSGIPVEHARDYCSDGCWEPHLQGRTYFKHGWVSLAEALDRVLVPERWQEVSVPVYIETMDPFKDAVQVDAYRFETFDEVMDAVKATLDRYIAAFIDARDSFQDGRLYDIAPLPLVSAFSRGPLESGRDITRGGIEYTIHMPELVGLSHVADSLAVIKKLCFEERSLPWTELLDAVRNNWEGKEVLRQRVITRVPCYGNDVDYVDEIAVEIVSFFADSIKRHSARSRSDIHYVPGIATFESYPELGYLVGATPDGRLAREPLSSNASPSIGRAVSGQTAAVNSYLKLPLHELVGGSILDLNMESGSGLLMHLEAFVQSFLERGGNILSIAVNDVETLRAARKEPEKYRDLKVRVGGYEAYFVDLPADHQELQIRRCEQYA
jgi:pyruvate-formate lyase